MACLQTLSGIAHDCAPSMGGIVEVYLANFADVTGLTFTDGVITTITMADDGGTPPISATFKKYSFPRNTGSLSSNYTIDKTTGANFVVSDLVMVFSKMETGKRVEVTALAQGELVAIVRDANRKLWYLGKDEPLVASAGDGLTGTARADRNGYSVTLQDNSLEMPFEVDETALAAVVA